MTFCSDCSAGPMVASLSSTSPDSWTPSLRAPSSSAVIALLRARSSCSSSPPSLISAAKSALLCDSVLVTLRVFSVRSRSCGVARRDRLRTVATARSAWRLTLAGVWRERLRQRLEALRQLGGVDAARRVGQPGQRGDHVDRASSCGRSGSSRPGPARSSPSGSSAMYSEPSRVLIRIEAVVLSPTQAFVDVELDPHLGAVQRDRVDRADLHAGDADVVTLAQPAGVGEVGRIRRCRRRSPAGRWSRRRPARSRPARPARPPRSAIGLRSLKPFTIPHLDAAGLTPTPPK